MCSEWRRPCAVDGRPSCTVIPSTCVEMTWSASTTHSSTSSTAWLWLAFGTPFDVSATSADRWPPTLGGVGVARPLGVSCTVTPPPPIAGSPPLAVPSVGGSSPLAAGAADSSTSIDSLFVTSPVADAAAAAAATSRSAAEVPESADSFGASSPRTK